MSVKVALDLVSDTERLFAYCRVKVHVPLQDILGENYVKDWPKIIGEIHDEIKDILTGLNTSEVVEFLDDNSLILESIAISYHFYDKTKHGENFGLGASAFLDTLKSNVLAEIATMNTPTEKNIIDIYDRLCRGRMNVINTPESDPIYTMTVADNKQPRMLLNKNRKKKFVVVGGNQRWVVKMILKFFKMASIVSICAFIIFRVIKMNR